MITFRAPELARATRAGQFVNILPKHGANDPLLRRPFSVYQIAGDAVSVIIQVTGRGTSLIAGTRVGEVLDVLGPLGNPWKLEGDYATAVLVIGGVGVASMPLLTKALIAANKNVLTYYGARTKSLFAFEGLVNLQLATDDGSEGSRGTNIALLEKALERNAIEMPKMFVCGPTGMMRAATSLAERFAVPCELSLETEMACGVGICQGCPVPTDERTLAETSKRFRLVCTDGPSFMAETIQL